MGSILPPLSQIHLPNRGRSLFPRYHNAAQRPAGGPISLLCVCRSKVCPSALMRALYMLAIDFSLLLVACIFSAAFNPPPPPPANPVACSLKSEVAVQCAAAWASPALPPSSPWTNTAIVARAAAIEWMRLSPGPASTAHGTGDKLWTKCRRIASQRRSREL